MSNIDSFMRHFEFLWVEKQNDREMKIEPDDFEGHFDIIKSHSGVDMNKFPKNKQVLQELIWMGPMQAYFVLCRNMRKSQGCLPFICTPNDPL